MDRANIIEVQGVKMPMAYPPKRVVPSPLHCVNHSWVVELQMRQVKKRPHVRVAKPHIVRNQKW